MQLFQAAKLQLRETARLISIMKAGMADPMVLVNTKIPLKDFAIQLEGREIAPGEPRVGIDGIDLKVAVDGRGVVDVESVREGVNDFVRSVLLFAFNPVRRGQTVDEADSNVDLAEMDGGRVGLAFKKLDLEHFDIRGAGERIDYIEKMLFSGWKVRSKDDQAVVKVFGTKAEREGVEHLFCCMAQAFGIQQDEVNRAFHKAPNDHAIILQKDFLMMLAEVEQTVELDLKSRRA